MDVLVPAKVTRFGPQETVVNIDEIIEALEIEKDRLTGVIAVLSPKARRGRRKGRRLSAAARKRISEGMRRNWAARKGRPKD